MDIEAMKKVDKKVAVEYDLELSEDGWGKYSLVDEDGNRLAKIYYDGHTWQWECDHSRWYNTDDDERGVCPICGSTCDWHEEEEVFDNYPDYIKSSKVPYPDEFYAPQGGYGGIIAELVEALMGRKAGK